jgi:ABC-type nitrate/sulfonate/bicarbonate transport system ATPase subunit
VPTLFVTDDSTEALVLADEIRVVELIKRPPSSAQNEGDDVVQASHFGG